MRKYVCKFNVSCLRQVYASCSDVVNPTFCPVLKRLNTVRWSSREMCIRAFVERQHCIILTLEKIQMDAGLDTKQRSDAAGLLSSI